MVAITRKTTLTHTYSSLTYLHNPEAPDASKRKPSSVLRNRDPSLPKKATPKSMRSVNKHNPPSARASAPRLDDEFPEATVRTYDEKESERPGERSSVSVTSRRSSRGAKVIGRRGIPKPNQPGSRGESHRPPQDDEEVDDCAPPPPSPPKPYGRVAP